ncbi:MAG: hypothetical protein ACRDS1_09090 [Pseudonocardiaceae bacterium]
MKLPTRVANPVLAVLIQHSGYNSLDKFAAAVNDLGAKRHGLKLYYDHIAVKRWLSGGTCQHAEVVAEVLGRAWNVPIPATVIWPQLRHGARAPAAHLYPCVAVRTLDELAAYIGSDMLTRRKALTDATKIAVGTALVGPLLRWLNAPAAGLPAHDLPGSSRLTMATVTGIEAATTQFGLQDAAIGGGLSREAAVGQLKHAVDLLRDTTYTEAVGNRMLAAVAELAGMVGWMSHDVRMDGPAQRYFTLGLQAARESGDPRAVLLRVRLLACMARQMCALDQPATGLQLVQAGLDIVPHGRHPASAAMLWNLKARMLGALGSDTVPEIRHAAALAVDLLAEAEQCSDREAIAYVGPAELAGNAALAWQGAAIHNPALARRAEEQALFALAHRPDGFNRSRVFDQISLAAARFTLTEADQAAADGHIALDVAAEVTTSGRVFNRLRTLLDYSAPYATRTPVRDFRDRLTLTLAAASG